MMGELELIDRDGVCRYYPIDNTVVQNLTPSNDLKTRAEKKQKQSVFFIRDSLI